MKGNGVYAVLQACAVVAAIIICVGWAIPAAAGNASIDMKMKYGGTSSQTGRKHMNKRYGYGSGSSSKTYSPGQGGPTMMPGQQPLAIDPRREMNQVIINSDEGKKESTIPGASK